jgi:hypothetical protein
MIVLNIDGREHCVMDGSVKITTQDGQTLYEIHMEKDGASLRIRGVPTQGDKAVRSNIVIEPVVSNVVKLLRRKTFE